MDRTQMNGAGGYHSMTAKEWARVLHPIPRYPLLATTP